jgi:hypothetical protein
MSDVRRGASESDLPEYSERLLEVERFLQN